MWKRVIWHLTSKTNGHKLSSSDTKEWGIDLFFYLLDVSLIPLFYYWISPLFKHRLRQLNKIEHEVAQEFYLDSIDLDFVWINASMPRNYRKFALAYVSQNIINYQDRISDAVFIHELLHVWQYQKYGIVYIYRALKAQQSSDAYNYGATQGVINGMYKGKPFIEFNFEQQAQIMEDYYKLRKMDMQLPMSSMEMSGYAYYYMQVVG